MPRQIRQHCFTKVYHVIMRGNEKKNIFKDDSDRYRFLDILYNKKQISGFDLYAYCLMSNHVHLLMKESLEELAECMKRVNISYALYFNKKYNRVGHLFQDRFKSECIDTQEYLLGALRYVHNNPVKAKIVSTPRDYKWSSFSNYININDTTHLVDTQEVLSLLSNNTRAAIKSFISLSNQKVNDCFMDCDDDEKIRDITIPDIPHAEEYVRIYLDNHNLNISSLRKRIHSPYRDELIAYLKEHSSLSLREIAHTLKISKNTANRVK